MSKLAIDGGEKVRNTSLPARRLFGEEEKAARQNQQRHDLDRRHDQRRRRTPPWNLLARYAGSAGSHRDLKATKHSRGLSLSSVQKLMRG